MDVDAPGLHLPTLISRVLRTLSLVGRLLVGLTLDHPPATNHTKMNFRGKTREQIEVALAGQSRAERRLKVEANGFADETRVEAVERRAARWVGYSLYALVVYVLFNSAFGLFVAHVSPTRTRARGES